MNSQRNCTTCILSCLIHTEYKNFKALTLLRRVSGSFTFPRVILTSTLKSFISLSKRGRGVFGDFSKVTQ